MDAQILNFSLAGHSEAIVHGSCKLGVSPESVSDWAGFMRQHGIERVCCLLDSGQLSSCRPSLESQCAAHPGKAIVCMAPIDNYHLVEKALLHEEILPFLEESDA